MSVTPLASGFSDPATQSANAFRHILQAMARPGRIATVAGAAPPAPLSVAAGIAILTLTDATTPLHLAGAADCKAVRGWIAFHTGAPLTTAEEALFAVGRWDDLLPTGRFRRGEPSYPDRSATLIIEVDRLLPQGARLTGPGIETEARLSLPATAEFRANHAQFPLGFDAILTCGDCLAALPRSTEVEDV